MSDNSRKLLIVIVMSVALFLFVSVLLNDLNSKKNSTGLIDLPSPDSIRSNSYMNTPSPSITIADQMVNCNIDVNCGGGTKYISKEECLNSICCRLGEKYIIYSDKNQCLRDQALLSGSQAASIKFVDTVVYVSAYNLYAYCKPEAVKQIKEQDKIVKEWIAKINQCSSGTQYEYSNCLKTCSDINSWLVCSQNCRDRSNISSCDALKESPLNSLNELIKANCR